VAFNQIKIGAAAFVREFHHGTLDEITQGVE
jgi:hypothetical protein